MKLKILTLILFFTFNTTSSFAVIDVKENAQTERIHNFQKENFSKKKKLKKRKFRLRDLFRWKKKIKKAKQEENIKTSPSAGWSLALAIVGSAIMLLGGINSGFLTVTFLLLEVIAFILGIIGLRSIKKYPKRFKGKEVAWAGIIISSLWMLIVLAFFYWLLFIYGN